MIRCAAEKWTTGTRYKWSNLRHRRSPKTTKINAGAIAKSMPELAARADDLLRHFEYRPDGITHLLDSIDTPAGAWEKAYNPGPLRDDCDGFHAALLWAAREMEGARLFTIVTSHIPDAHTLLIIEGKELLTQDYRSQAGPFKTIDLAARHIIKTRKMRGEFWLAEMSVFKNGWWSYKTIKAEG